MIFLNCSVSANNTSNQDFLNKKKGYIHRRRIHDILFLNEDLLMIMGICIFLATINDLATARPMPQKLCNLIIIKSTLND